MRNMEQSSDEYYSANDESFKLNNNNGNLTSTIMTTVGARKQISTSEPQKPLSAYALFFRDTVSTIKQQNPNCSFQELSRIVASMWDILEEDAKNLYTKKNETACNEYVKQMQIFKQQQQQPFQTVEVDSNNSVVHSKASVFKINQSLDNASAVSEVHSQNLKQTETISTTNTPVNVSNSPASTTPTTTKTNAPLSPQIQLLTEAGAVQMCSRQNCNKRAIINPDWEDEYCSNECVISHCRNVFNSWVQSNLDAREQLNS